MCDSLMMAVCVCCVLQPVNNADFIIPVEIDGTVHQVKSISIPLSYATAGTLWRHLLFILGMFNVS